MILVFKISSVSSKRNLTQIGLNNKPADIIFKSCGSDAAGFNWAKWAVSLSQLSFSKCQLHFLAKYPQLVTKMSINSDNILPVKQPFLKKIVLSI